MVRGKGSMRDKKKVRGSVSTFTIPFTRDKTTPTKCHHDCLYSWMDIYMPNIIVMVNAILFNLGCLSKELTKSHETTIAPVTGMRPKPKIAKV